MEPGTIQAVRTVKRLSEAIGYLELGMVEQALVCLQGLDEPGRFAGIAEMLRGEVARRQHRLDDAARSFEAAAKMLPAPDDKSVWLVLSDFHRQAGNTDLAIETLAHARGAWRRKAKPKEN
jgi:tetratricopeptide (TPR) repeat protein